MSALLFGVPPLDPLTFATAAIVAFAGTTQATTIPALAAARIDPVLASRAE